MSIQKKKFKKLRKELQYWLSDLEYTEEVLDEWHHKFEEYYRKYCEEYRIDIDRLNKENKKKVDEILPSGLVLKPESGTTKFEDRTDEKQFKKVYKQIARKLHPDIGGDEEQFKEATTALSEKNFEKLLDICEEHDILVEVDEEINKVIQKQIEETKQKINKAKSTYSWKLYECEDNKNCKKDIVKRFLKHLFNYSPIII